MTPYSLLNNNNKKKTGGEAVLRLELRASCLLDMRPRSQPQNIFKRR
jgi:hypothetical protein